MNTEENEKKVTNEISFTKKCILMSLINKETEFVLINSFNEIPIVKLYTADIDNENFVYSGLKGALCLIKEKDKLNDESIFYLILYSLKTFEILFKIEFIFSFLSYYNKLDDYFYYFLLNESYIGFKFYDKEIAKKFFEFCKSGNFDLKTIEQNQNSQNIDLTKEEYSNDYKSYCSVIKEDLYSKYRNLSLKFRILSSQTNLDYVDFFYLNYIDKILKNVEFDEQNNLINIFMPSNYNEYKSYKEYLEKFLGKLSDVANNSINIVVNDYTCIKNKNYYLGLLSNNIINDIEVQKKLITTKNEYKQKQKTEYFKKSKDINLKDESSNRKSVSEMKFGHAGIRSCYDLTANLKSDKMFFTNKNDNDNKGRNSLNVEPISKIEKKKNDKENILRETASNVGDFGSILEIDDIEPPEEPEEKAIKGRERTSTVTSRKKIDLFSFMNNNSGLKTINEED